MCVNFCFLLSWSKYVKPNVSFEAPSFNSFFRYLDYKISIWPSKRDITLQREIMQRAKYGSAFLDDKSIYEISKS